MILTAAVLYAYMLGGVWQIGPFTDLASCEQARAFQITNGIKDVSTCQPVMLTLGTPTFGAPLTPEEYARRMKP